MRKEEGDTMPALIISFPVDQFVMTGPTSDDFIPDLWPAG